MQYIIKSKEVLLLNNSIVVKGLEEALLEVSNFSCYTIDNRFSKEKDVFNLGALSLILANSLEELIILEEKKRSIKEDVKKHFEDIVKNKFNKLRCDKEYREDFENKLEDNLYIMYKNQKSISRSPSIKFIYWALKNTRRILVSPEEIKKAAVGKQAYIDFPPEIGEVEIMLKTTGTNLMLMSYVKLIFSTINEFKLKGNTNSKAAYSELLDQFMKNVVQWGFFYNNID